MTAYEMRISYWSSDVCSSDRRYTWDEPSVCSNGRTSISLATGMTLAKPYDGTGECRADGGSAFGPGSFFGSTKSKAPTYNFGVDWAVSDDAFFYVTTRRGYRAGALNTPRLAPVLAPFQRSEEHTSELQSLIRISS